MDTRCECLNWATTDLTHIILTGHHENCSNSPNVLKCALEMIRDLSDCLENSTQNNPTEKSISVQNRAKLLQGDFSFLTNKNKENTNDFITEI